MPASASTSPTRGGRTSAAKVDSGDEHVDADTEVESEVESDAEADKIPVDVVVVERELGKPVKQTKLLEPVEITP